MRIPYRSRLTHFLLGLLAFSGVSCSTGSGPELQLRNLDGLVVDPIGDTRARATVFLFARTDCPISNRYAPEVRRLYQKFSPENIVFWLVYVDPSRPAEEIRQHVNEYQYPCGVLLDRGHDLVRLTGAQVTPEAAVFLPGGEMVYRGRIDDLYLEFGVRRAAATSHDLEEILEAILEGRALNPVSTRAVGCFISDLKSEQPADRPFTFSRHIAPVVFENCAACHHPGGSAPFGLLTYDDVKKRAQQIALVTQSRYMPPWLPEPGYGDFSGERRLSDAQIEMIRKWVEQGTLEGDPSDLPAMPQLTEEWHLGRPDLVLQVAETYTLPSQGADVFRNFVIPVPVSETRYVKAIEIDPGQSRKVVHHANVLIDQTAASRRLDEKDSGVGFGGMELYLESPRFEPQSHFLFWKPGSVPAVEPEGMAWRLDPGTSLVLNMHLQPSGRPEAVRARVGLYFTDQAPTRYPMLLQLENDGALDIPAEAKEFVVSEDYVLPVDVEVLGVYPHAHYLGKDLRGYATLPDGTRKWLIWIKNWDFNWQAVYRYRRPLFLLKGTVLSMRYSYDNSAENPRNPNRPPRRVRAGNQSTDEMAHLWIQVLPREKDDRLTLQETLMRHRLQKYPNDSIAHANLGAVLQLRGRFEEALRHFQESVRIEPEDAITRNNLGAALQAQGNLAEALAQYREALRMDPGYADARYNLGSLLLAQGQAGEAIRHLEQIVRANARDVAGRRKLADAHNELGYRLAAGADLVRAAPHFQRAIALDPAHAAAHVNLGHIFARQGNAGQAITHYQRALEIGPPNADLHNDLGIALALQGHVQQAARHFEEALRIDPHHQAARSNLERTRR